MKNIQSLEFIEGSKEELLPDFAPDFPYIATCAELDKYVNASAPWHWHRAVELFFVESGCLEYTTPNGTWTFPAGSGGLVNSNILHATRAIQTTERNVQLLHLFEPSLISGEHGNRMEQKYVLPLISNPGIEMIALSPSDPKHSEILRQIRQAFDLCDQTWGYELRLREALVHIWMDLQNIAPPLPDERKDPNRSNEQIKLMMVCIHEHWNQHISVDYLAAAGHTSKRGCFRLFQENLHMTPMEYIRSYRLRMACRMLSGSDLPITEIASRCGLGSSSYFGKLFREEFGCTPLQYRKYWHDRDRNRHP